MLEVCPLARLALRTKHLLNTPPDGSGCGGGGGGGGGGSSATQSYTHTEVASSGSTEIRERDMRGT